jgi:hypothetical protein
MLSLDTAYRSFGGEVEASSTPTICRLPDSRRHQLPAIALRSGKPATFGKADEQAIYDLAQELLATREVSDKAYAAAKEALGERGVLDCVAVLGYYSLIAMSMKTFAQTPEGVADPFADR